MDAPGWQGNAGTRPGDAYLAALRVSGAAIKRMAREVTKVMTLKGATDELRDWARELTDGLCFGVSSTDAIELLLMALRPKVELADRIEDVANYGASGNYRPLAEKMG